MQFKTRMPIIDYSLFRDVARARSSSRMQQTRDRILIKLRPRAKVYKRHKRDGARVCTSVDAHAVRRSTVVVVVVVVKYTHANARERPLTLAASLLFLAPSVVVVFNCSSPLLTRSRMRARTHTRKNTHMSRSASDCRRTRNGRH